MNRANSPRSSIGDRAAPQSWYQFPTDLYLDHRCPNWVLAEEFGDVIFVPSTDVVLVHPERAEHIVQDLLKHLRALPARRSPEPARLPSSSAVGHAREAAPAVEIVLGRSRWRGVAGWLGVVAGVAIYAVALALQLDDPALLIALAVVARSCRTMAAVPMEVIEDAASDGLRVRVM